MIGCYLLIFFDSIPCSDLLPALKIVWVSAFLSLRVSLVCETFFCWVLGFICMFWISLFSIFISSFAEVSRSLNHFKLIIVCFIVEFEESFVYFAHNSPLSNRCFTNIFFQSVIYLFIFLTVFFAKQKFLIPMKSNLLPTFSLMDQDVGVLSKKLLTNLKVTYRFSPMLSSKS